MIELIGGIITFLGSVFLFLGSLGILRMPDVYNRMQAGTKASTLGSILFFVGIAFMGTEWIGKLVILIIFIIFTNPVSSHALARAAHFAQIKLAKQSVIDELANRDKGVKNG